MGLIDTVEEQQVFGFSGKINILDSLSGRILGFIALHEGDLYHCLFRSQTGKSALFNLFVKDRERANFRVIVEPEMVEGLDKNLFYTTDEYKREFEQEFLRYKESQGTRPPNGLKLSIRPDFVIDGPGLTRDEYILLETIADYQKISDIYDRVNLYEHRTTNALVGLRKKGALKVLSG